jgi:hypothetical protein
MHVCMHMYVCMYVCKYEHIAHERFEHIVYTCACEHIVYEHICMHKQHRVHEAHETYGRPRGLFTTLAKHVIDAVGHDPPSNHCANISCWPKLSNCSMLVPYRPDLVHDLHLQHQHLVVTLLARDHAPDATAVVELDDVVDTPPQMR